MNDPDLPELALTEKEVDEILRSCDGRALLVGGQALAFEAESATTWQTTAAGSA